jgi:hypothetical protein
MMIEYLLGSDATGPAESLDAVLDTVAEAPGFPPFSDEVVAFVGALSQRILTDRAFRGHPELMAMAHWFRLANLRKMRDEFQASQRPQSVFVRRGVVFHLAPSNVDSVFIYSWLISLLCGNNNIARVSRRRSEQMRMFFAIVAELLTQASFSAIALGNLVLSYDHDAELTQTISRRCHLRVIWGGDATVQQIRAIPLPPLATDLAFANRFSLATLNAAAIAALSTPALEALAQGFYNDAFWFNQQACSSPRVVIWVGASGSMSEARERFWAAVEAQVRLRQPENLPAQLMDRTTTVFRMAHNHPNAQLESALGALPSRILVSELDAEDRVCHDGNGLFLELEREQLAQVIPLLSSRDQTITYFGYEREQWIGLLASLPPHAADRIVPVGQALDFGTVWDGVDLRRAFTREIQLHGTARP